MMVNQHRETDKDLEQLRVFSGTSNPQLTKKICESIGVRQGRASIDRFPDGEQLMKLEDDVRGTDCFVVQSTCPPVNDNLMQLLIFIDCLRRASAERITAVIPYFGYARQDRKTEGRTPITAKLVANMIASAGVDRVLTMDLHADQIQGFFDIPVDHLTAAPVLCSYFSSLNLKNTTIVSPDAGNIKKANDFTSILGAELAVIDKRRDSSTRTTAVHIIGDVAGRTVLIFDDMITTAGTATAAARIVRDHGAVACCLGATHAVFAEPALERLKQAEFQHLVVTDTIPVAPAATESLKSLTVLSVSNLIGEAIRRIHLHESVSALFEMFNHKR
jgi:ribose-phosphate pyrophosphokinase